MKKKVLFYENSFYKRLVFSLFLAVFTIYQASAQDRRITGTVTTAEDGTPLPGVNIRIKGTGTGTVTNLDGHYSVNVPDENAVLEFSFVGYIPESIPVNNKSVIDVSLTPDIESLQEVVVIGYGTQERKDISGSISSISAEEIQKVPINTIDQAIQGRTPGVQVTNNDAAPGGNVSVRIRGIGSLGNNSPLYVVDGYPVTGINNLNPNDIASMDILKDASATAIYGSRASNGVVIITTKRGNKDGLQVSFDATGSYQSVPEFYEVLNAQQFAGLATELAQKESFEVLPEWNNPSALRTINWQEELYQPGYRQNYTLAVRGGNDKMSSSFSLGYTDQTGIIKLSEFTRYNAALNLDYTPKDWLKSSTSLKYTRSSNPVRLGSGQSGIGLLTTLIPTMTGNPETDQVKDANGNYGYYTKGSTALAASTNILADIETQDRVDASNIFLGTTFLEVTLLDGLRVKTNLGINFNDNSGYYFTPTHERTEPAARNFYSQYSNHNFEWLWENTLAYTRTFGIHNIDVVAGISAQESTYRTLSFEGNDLLSDEFRSVGAIQTPGLRSGYEESASLASQFGRVTYKLYDKYIITGTVRRDGSSNFGTGNKYGIFPSVGAAWRLGDEEFMADFTAVSDLKIRGSRGETGNQFIAPFGYLGLYDSGPNNIDNRGYVFGRNKTFYPGIALTQLPNPDLTWETTVQSNIGLDAVLFNGKLSLTADYFVKESRDFLLDIDVPAQTGFTKAKRNVGSIRNSGLELSAEYRNNSRKLKWAVGANITTINNEILEFADGLEAVPNFNNLNFPNYGANTWQVFSRSQVGGEVGAFYGYRTAGIFQNQSEIDAVNARAAELAEEGEEGVTYQGTTVAPGDRKFADIDGDGRVTENDREIIGSPIPDFYGGINLNASYGAFDFSMFWYASVGNEILNYAKRNLQSFATNGGVGMQNVSREFYENRWTEQNPSDEFPRAVREDVAGNTRVSDAYVEDGSFLRLRNLQIGYTLPSAMLEKASIGQLRVFVSGQNLLTFTKYSGLDPEVGEALDSDGNRNVTAAGLDLGNYPTSPSFTLGLNLQF